MIADSDVFPLVQSSETKKVPFSVLRIFAGTAVVDGLDNLRPITTVELEVNLNIRFVYADSDITTWLLITGTNEDDPDAGYVRPDDYEDGVNEKVWKRVSDTADSGIATAIQTVRVIPISDSTDPESGDLLTYDELLDAWRPGQFRFLQDSDDPTKKAVFDISDTPTDTLIYIHIAGVTGNTTVVPAPDESGDGNFVSGLNDDGTLIFSSVTGGPSIQFSYRPDIISLTGSEPALQSEITVGKSLKYRIDTFISGNLRSWFLTTGAADGGDPTGQVAPTDYNVGTNNVHWQLGA